MKDFKSYESGFSRKNNYSSSEHLDRLALFLNYEISSSVLFMISFFASIFIIIAIIVAGAFVPYMIYVLLKEGRHGWIILFNVLVILPLLLILIVLPSYLPIFVLISVGMFYFYCFMLRLAVNDWIRENNWRLQLIEQREMSRLNEIKNE